LAKRTLNGAAAIALVFFLWLALEVSLGRTLAFDTALRDAVHARAWPPLTSAMLLLTRMGEPTFLVVVTILAAWLLGSTGHRRIAAVAALSTLGAVAVSESLKLAFHRMRPAAFFGYQEPAGYSFPSGHAITALCFYGILTTLLATRMKSRAWRRILWGAAAILVFLVGFSRVYLGVHHPTDVVAGYALGFAWVAGVLHVEPLPVRREKL